MKYTPPNSDRSGKTVSDLAPETFANDKYSGSQDSSKGIIGLLEVILSDFDRSIAAVTDEEETNQGEYDKFKQESEGGRSAITQTSLDLGTKTMVLRASWGVS